ncbi:serine protease [Parafrankia colletiae]|uniref:Serine protease n=1 Tax=Parafrankia colletiae TaxID=573497 RepID=A0A1S1RJE4_9ACTN|nr:CAP domain-containing protein [Parafrankia colletiae]MCK9902469.1 CAP domain-containing protein [Frankia sp. Cpl3]OHV46157.1 serine protease [Parafrankia colletiae]
MAPVRKAVASAATAVALMAAVASCRSGPGGSPGGGYHPPTPAPSVSASASTAPTPGTPGTTTPAAPTTAPATTAPGGPTTAPPTIPPAPTSRPPVPTTRPPVPTTPPGNPPTQNPPPPPPATTPPANPPGTGTPQDEILRLTNVERQKAGCGPLLFDASLTAAAQAHSADMATNNYFSHTGQNGSTAGSRAQAAGWPNGYVGENIAAGSTTPAATIQMWMNSSGHRANILNCAYTHLGVGYAQGGGTYRYYWTQAFGRR